MTRKATCININIAHTMASQTHVQRVRILYKTILRLHRGLPIEIQSLGNNYVRDEFRRHRKCVESEAIVFLHEWTVSRKAVVSIVEHLMKLQDYAISLANQLGLKGPHTGQPFGKNLKEEDLEKLRDEQVHQLYELMIAATGETENNINKKKT